MSKIVTHHRTIYLCGQVGSGEGVVSQTTDCLSRIDALLAEAGKYMRLRALARMPSLAVDL